MVGVSIPFMDRFKVTMLSGRKTLTSRNKSYGKPGDRFMAFGEIFEIKAVWQERIGNVARDYYAEEGCTDPMAFEELWAKIHPRVIYDPAHVVYVHRFARVAEQPG